MGRKHNFNGHILGVKVLCQIIFIYSSVYIYILKFIVEKSDHPFYVASCFSRMLSVAMNFGQ
jgi:hypothetical protein